MSLTESVLRPLLSAPARPLVTHYDDAAGTRIELSVATMHNWAAKTANWLTDELDVEPGDPVAVALPAHWQTAAVLLGAWWCGAHVVSLAAGATVAFVPPGGAAPGAATVAAVSLDPMGRDLGGTSSGILDYVGESRLHGDDFPALTPVPGTTPCLADSTVDEVLATARSRATELGIEPGVRVLSTLDWSTAATIVDGLLAPLVTGASLVQVTNPDPAKLAGHQATERATHTLP